MRALLLLSTAAVASWAAPSRADEIDWKGRMMTELPKAWESVRAVCGNLEGTLNEHVQEPAPPHKQSDHKVTRFVMKDKRVLYKPLRKGQPPGEEMVYGLNENYGFALGRGDGKFAVLALAERDGKGDARLNDLAESDVYGTVWSPWTSRCIPLAEWLTKPGFTVVSVKPQQVGAKRLVRLEYTYRDPNPRDPKLAERSNWDGYHLLAPDDSWVIHESFIKFWQGSDTFKIQHKDRIGGFPVGHRTVIEGRAPSGERVSDFVWATSDLKPSQASYHDFTLSAFGLPEPTFAPRRGSRWPIYLGLAAGFALLAVGLRWWAKRRRASLG